MKTYTTGTAASGRGWVQCRRCDYYGVGADETVADSLGRAHEKQHGRGPR